MNIVYFIKPVGMDGPIKIGSTKFAPNRLGDLAVWSPLPLEVAATVTGDHIMERRFHAKFAAQHSHHEWFEYSAELGRVIDEINAGTFDPSNLPEPRVIASTRWSEDRRRRQSELMKSRWNDGMYADRAPVRPRVKKGGERG